ncbi:MAG: DUF4157 domain-containing protein [Nostoc sp. ChiQUE02]|uniref:eCIS core domain-containing protein n=1 Tax=Nostoc sp. ChiQUE02 TaxID=3075377 RepID=UPI002AD41ACF|nr:DUF4157 domain-containing protein [Nostoc sp. ChiQUE02]MDZ8231943.1 DUF4157 domain-containing protein [Nostoc sp. ChiQUE02]
MTGMVYQRVQKAAAWNPQHDTQIKKQHPKTQPKSASSSGLSAQERIDSLPDVPANWMSLDPVMRRIQAKAAAMQLASSQKSDDSSAVNTDAVQMKCSQCEEKEKVQLHADGETQLSADGSHEQVQLHANGQTPSKSIQQVAAQGFSGSATRLPHLNKIQQSFGINLSHVQAYIGGRAAAACNQMGAAAYASGNQIAFKEAPSVELAAHEAAHVVQQQSGKVQLSGGVGQVGDKYEQHADEVAARVGAGQSAGDLLAEYSKEHSSAVTLTDTQMKASDDAFQKEALYAQAGVFDRGPLPPRKTPPNQDKCRQILHDIIVYLIAGILERVVSADIGKEVTRGLPERYRQLRRDKETLYKNYTSNPKPGVGSWNGHIKTYEDQRRDLNKLLDDWKRSGCGDLDKIRNVTKEQINQILEEAKYWANKPAPDKPDNTDIFELPEINLPEFEFNFDWIVPIFRILWGNEQTA